MEPENTNGGCAATPPEELRKRFMDVLTSHNEEHWWAINEIERITKELALKDADLLLERDRAKKAEQAFNEWENKAGQYMEERDKAEKELETERMRLAGCSVAALGYFDGCSEEYKSASLSDVLALRERYDKAVSAYKEVSEQKLKAEDTANLLRDELMNPPPDIQERVLKLLGIWPLHDYEAAIERAGRLEAQVKMLVEALEEQRRQMEFPDLPKAFALTMKRMIDGALAKIKE